MEPDLVVFDIAGTTLHDPDIVLDSFREALAPLRIRLQRDEVVELMGLAKREAVTSLLTRLLRGATPHPQLIEQVLARFEALCIDRYRHDPEIREVHGASDVFRALHLRGMKVALDTGFSRPVTEAILRRTGWLSEGLVDAVVTSSEVRLGRPAPDMILAIQRRLGLRAPRLAKIGDTLADLQEGMAAGASWNIAITSGAMRRAELERGPYTHLVDRLADVLPVLETPPEPRRWVPALRVLEAPTRV